MDAVETTGCWETLWKAMSPTTSWKIIYTSLPRPFIFGLRPLSSRFFNSSHFFIQIGCCGLSILVQSSLPFINDSVTNPLTSAPNSCSTVFTIQSMWCLHALSSIS
jgi:hypothetical protein